MNRYVAVAAAEATAAAVSTIFIGVVGRQFFWKWVERAPSAQKTRKIRHVGQWLMTTTTTIPPGLTATTSANILSFDD